MKLWIVGQLINIGSHDWEFQGIFSSEELAISACYTHMYFVGPVQLDVEFPQKTMDWPGAYYPKSMKDFIKKN